MDEQIEIQIQIDWLLERQKEREREREREITITRDEIFKSKFNKFADLQNNLTPRSHTFESMSILKLRPKTIQIISNLNAEKLHSPKSLF